MNALFEARRADLSNAILDLEAFLLESRADIDRSPDASNANAIHHLDTRRLIQVHLTNVIEASSNYDLAVRESLHQQETERREQVLRDAGVLNT